MRPVLAAMALGFGLHAPVAEAAPPFPLGAWLTNPNGSDPGAEATYEQNVRHFKSTMNAAPTYIDSYLDYTQAIVQWPSNANWEAWSNRQSVSARNMIPVIGFPMASLASGSASADQQFQWFASGAYDSQIAGVVQAWASNGFKTLIFRPGWEMNLGGSTYVGDTAQDWADWVAAFRRIYTVLHSAGQSAGVTIKVVWNPGATNYTTVHATSSLYPGDHYVDIVGADVYAGMYPFGGSSYYDWDTHQLDYSLAQFMADPVNRRHYWTYPAATQWSNNGSEGHSETFLALLKFAKDHNKPFAVPETGAGSSDSGHDISDENTFPHWLHTHLSKAQADGQKISFVIIWDANAVGNYEFSYPSDHKPKEAAAWGKYFGG